MALGVAGSSADIIFEKGNNPITGSENVLFDPSSGSTIEGTFNGNSYVVNFTSASGNGLLEAPSSGQARIEGQSGNSPLKQITFKLAGGATFTGAIFNPNNGSGNAKVTVHEPNGESTSYDYVLLGGNNFLTVTAVNGQKISYIEFETDGGMRAFQQVRIAGFESPNQVPDGGLTAMLLGVALTGLAAARKRLV